MKGSNKQRGSIGKYESFRQSGSRAVKRREQQRLQRERMRRLDQMRGDA